MKSLWYLVKYFNKEGETPLYFRKNMREIKFRVWDKRTNRMLDNVSTGTIMVIIKAESKDCILLQYIGLKDKNNKKIYEGDIVKFYSKRENGDGGNHSDLVVKIVFDVAGFKGVYLREEDETVGNIIAGILQGSEGHDDKEEEKLVDLKGCVQYAKEFEIIGNIYENPELLEDTN